MRARELRNLTPDELAEKLVASRKELFSLRFQSATGSLEDTTRLRHARREIARILTVQLEHAKTRS